MPNVEGVVENNYQVALDINDFESSLIKFYNLIDRCHRSLFMLFKLEKT